MKDPFKTRKMQTIPMPVQPAQSPEPSSSPPSSLRPPFGPPSSDSSWHTGDVAAERRTDPAMPLAAAVAPGGKDRAMLTVLTGFSAGQVYALDGTEHVIGRGTEADIWVEDGGVSRRHARIKCRADGRYFVEDLGSTNGTYLGQRKLDSPVPMEVGVPLRIGKTVLELR